MRITQKQVNTYVSDWLKNTSVATFQNEIINVLRDLSKYPQENKYQIRFYFKVFKRLITKYE